ncbi:MAG: hypothetical protein V3S64_15175, partial [bacterium]
IENSTINFPTRLSVRSATVVVAKPAHLSGALTKGGTVRFKIPDSEGKEIRMEVLTPHFNLTSGNPVFLCKVPTVFAEGNLRGAMRYNTSKFTNVVLTMPPNQSQFRIVDLSEGGCKIYVPGQLARETFPIGASIAAVRITLGTKVTVVLDSLTPRNHRGQTVGCSLTVSDQGTSKKYLTHLINSLEKMITEQFQA